MGIMRVLAGVALAALLGWSAAVRGQPSLPPAVLLGVLNENQVAAQKSLDRVRAAWRHDYAAPMLELLGFIPSQQVRQGVAAALAQASGRPFDGTLDGWYRWLWSLPPTAYPDYAEFKAGLYEQVDPRFREYFAGRPRAEIRLDEIRWGGVWRDGIPPLESPKMIPAAAATYLGADDVVFGVAIDGDVRAYPKRILAWHEMFRDRIAGRPLNGVYCTLCGSMILYDVTVKGVHHVLGTSGFLYRSNKLMYDHATKSLWSTLTGTPVVGPLVGQGIELKTLHIVTTTWKEWRKRHPRTMVLSLDTGHQRDYSEGAAYREYFATDRLMFGVPKLDDRLPNKAEVLALRFAGSPGEQLALSASYLRAHPVHHDRIGRQDFVVLTDASGANRVYETQGIRFTAWDGDSQARDARGRTWTVTEDGLDGPGGQFLGRLPAHRAFWFGWYAAFPGTRLVK
jgi:hypothetical protein